MNDKYKKMQKLTLKELAPYLPYDLKIKSHNGKDLFTLASHRFYDDYSNNDLSIHSMIEDNYVKPVLRPLSDITLKLVQQLFGLEIEQFRMKSDNENDFSLEVLTDLGWTSITFNEYQKLLAYHFDLFMLIEKGLAVDINTLSVE